MGVAFIGCLIGALSAAVSVMNGAGFTETALIYSLSGTLGTLLTATLIYGTPQTNDLKL